MVVKTSGQRREKEEYTNRLLWGLGNKQERARSAERKKNKMEGHRKQRQKTGLTQSFTLRRFKPVFIIIIITSDFQHKSTHRDRQIYTHTDGQNLIFTLSQTAEQCFCSLFSQTTSLSFSFSLFGQVISYTDASVYQSTFILFFPPTLFSPSVLLLTTQEERSTLHLVVLCSQQIQSCVSLLHPQLSFTSSLSLSLTHSVTPPSLSLSPPPQALPPSPDTSHSPPPLLPLCQFTLPPLLLCVQLYNLSP